MKARSRISVAAFSLVLATAAGTPSLAAGEHDHGYGATTATGLHLNAGKKWETDKALRQAMDGINQDMAKALPAIHKSRFADSEYAVLAANIEQKVGYAVEHCKLAPEADAMLHIVIADLMAGVEVMGGKTDGSRHDGAVRVLKALQSYGKYFQHPGWKVAKG